jgi:hypothetical protein
MNPSSLTPIEYAALREHALRRAHEMRREAIIDVWNALFAVLRRLVSLGGRASRSVASSAPMGSASMRR